MNPNTNASSDTASAVLEAPDREYLAVFPDGSMRIYDQPAISDVFDLADTDSHDAAHSGGLPSVYTVIEGHLVPLTLGPREACDEQSHPVIATQPLLTPSGRVVGHILRTDH